MRPTQLTKSRYMHGRQCQKRLWLEHHRPELKSSPSAAERRLLEQGTEIGALARQTFSGGVLVQAHGRAAEARTAELVQAGVPAIFEAAFCQDDVLVRCDVLRRTHGKAWDLIEVKASTRVKPEHLYDLALQRYVLERCGVPVAKAILMHVNNRTYRYPDLSTLFVQEDVTDAVAARLPSIPAELAQLAKVLAAPVAPDRPVGRHCTHPVACSLHDHCWRTVPPTSIWFMPRMNARTKEALAQRDIYEIAHLPAEQALSNYQERYVRAVMTGQDDIDHAAIHKLLARLAYPLHFFDFETDGPALPRLAGCAPYSQFPFQYSLHILEQDGQLRHHDYLHEGMDDPRPALLAALERDVQPEGSVVVYNAQFERGVLRRLAEQFPAATPWLEELIDRLWDQLEVFRRHYVAAAFRGSNSIKRVLPVLVPELTYADLDVQKGDDAQAVWNEMIRLPPGETKAARVRALRAYCARDTLAMVAIHERLSALCLAHGEGGMARK